MLRQVAGKFAGRIAAALPKYGDRATVEIASDEYFVFFGIVAKIFVLITSNQDFNDGTPVLKSKAGGKVS